MVDTASGPRLGRIVGARYLVGGQLAVDPADRIRVDAVLATTETGLVRPVVSGEATLDDIKRAYSLAWQKMLKAVALYRDGSKLSQPLSIAITAEEEEELAREADAGEPLGGEPPVMADAAIASGSPGNNPRQATREEIIELYKLTYEQA